MKTGVNVNFDLESISGKASFTKGQVYRLNHERQQFFNPDQIMVIPAQWVHSFTQKGSDYSSKRVFVAGYSKEGELCNLYSVKKSDLTKMFIEEVSETGEAPIIPCEAVRTKDDIVLHRTIEDLPLQSIWEGNQIRFVGVPEEGKVNDLHAYLPDTIAFTVVSSKRVWESRVVPTLREGIYDKKVKKNPDDPSQYILDLGFPSKVQILRMTEVPDFVRVEDIFKAIEREDLKY